MYRKIIVGYKADRHGEDSLALARVLSSPDSVQHVFVVQAGDDSSDGPGERDVSAGWPAHVSVSVRAAAGSSPAEALGSMAAELGADLVVLGSTHRGFVGRILLGTTADHIAADSDLTFVVAPEGFQGTAIRKIGI